LTLFSESELFSNSKQWFDEVFFVYVSKSIFGISPESLDLITRDSIFQSISERFINLTIEDVKIAFRTHTQAEKVYILTRDEFLKPIQNFWNKKMIVKRELDIEIKKNKSELYAKFEVEQFFNESIEIYKDDLAKGNIEYSGTCFNAQTFAALKFAERFNQEEKNEIFAKAKTEYSKRMIQFEDDPKVVKLPPPHVNFIFSKLIVDHALANCFEI
jgi:hypothetical protein